MSEMAINTPLFVAGGGRWASEKLLRAMQQGRPLSVSELRSCDTLRKDEWKVYDTALIEEGKIRLRGVGDLMTAGLVINVPGAFGKTVFEYESISDLTPASVSMDGLVKTNNDRLTFDLRGLPLPLTHKDFFLNLRTLEASRTRGAGLDVTQARMAGRVVTEAAEYMLFRGGKTFGGYVIYGYTTHPDRNTVAYGAGGPWSSVTKTGDQMLADIQTMFSAAEADRMYGPYMLYVDRAANINLNADFKAASDKSVRSRLLETNNLIGIGSSDQMPANTLLLVQMTLDVAAWVNGEPLQTIQWDVEGGFQINFKAFQIGVPLIRSDGAGRSGIVHMS